MSEKAVRNIQSKKMKYPCVLKAIRMSFPKTKTCAFCHYVLPVLKLVEIPAKQNAGYLDQQAQYSFSNTSVYELNSVKFRVKIGSCG